MIITARRPRRQPTQRKTAKAKAEEESADSLRFSVRPVYRCEIDWNFQQNNQERVNGKHESVRSRRQLQVLHHEERHGRNVLKKYH